MAELKAIETRYKGYRFRSRLEARWAVFFDTLGLQWEYEPEGFSLPSGKYLPDFRVGGTYVEVKPNLNLSIREREHLIYLSAYHETILADGLPRETMYAYSAIKNSSGYDWISPIIGVKDSDREGTQYFCSKSWRTPGLIYTWFDSAVNFFGGQDSRDIALIRRACTAATSARFEHGECPA